MFDRFEWDAANEDHCLRHSLSPDDVEDAFYNPLVFAPAYNQHGERRHAIIGVTDGAA